MKTLKKAMKVVKFLRFFTGLEWFCSLLCLIGSAVSFFTMLTLQTLDRAELILKIEEAAKMPAKAIIVGSLIGITVFFFSLILAGASKRYYADVVASGTPFSQSSADGMRSLGWKHLLVPIAVSVTVSIIAMAFNVSEAEIGYTVSGSGLGLVYLFFAPFVRYGAELEREKVLSGNQ